MQDPASEDIEAEATDSRRSHMTMYLSAIISFLVTLVFTVNVEAGEGRCNHYREGSRGWHQCMNKRGNPKLFEDDSSFAGRCNHYREGSTGWYQCMNHSGNPQVDPRYYYRGRSYGHWGRGVHVSGQVGVRGSLPWGYAHNGYGGMYYCGHRCGETHIELPENGGGDTRMYIKRDGIFRDETILVEKAGSGRRIPGVGAKGSETPQGLYSREQPDDRDPMVDPMAAVRREASLERGEESGMLPSPGAPEVDASDLEHDALLPRDALSSLRNYADICSGAAQLCLKETSEKRENCKMDAGACLADAEKGLASQGYPGTIPFLHTPEAAEFEALFCLRRYGAEQQECPADDPYFGTKRVVMRPR